MCWGARSSVVHTELCRPSVCLCVYLYLSPFKRTNEYVLRVVAGRSRGRKEP